MNSSPKPASNPTGKSRRKEVNLDLTTARQMLPLVRSIVTDIVDTTERLTNLAPERDTLDEYRRSLTWASRERRYALQDAIAASEKNLEGAVRELDTLGVSLVDSHGGRVDFPTRINGRPAAYSWQLGEDAVSFWRYAGEELRRPIPADWQPASTRTVAQP
ncbi:DUF2203 family protein [Limnoglobus roseus]|uniref:DUF2203 domain-containing protein n=1 Tax=Limnoglobus roseus TaxID=2598579 RepID=A0A5C1A8Z3_9BACT|nr:DUF2203 family protein [Limnoglobus roseus]QEL13574.1 hypothetical protein PX52LOC_00432 [Limnoglobus roseus]